MGLGGRGRNILPSWCPYTLGHMIMLVESGRHDEQVLVSDLFLYAEPFLQMGQKKIEGSPLWSVVGPRRESFLLPFPHPTGPQSPQEGLASGAPQRWSPNLCASFAENLSASRVSKT